MSTYDDAHERDFVLLNRQVENLQLQARLHKVAHAPIFLFLLHKFRCDDDDIYESITDEGNDCGVDAVYIQSQGADPVIHIFQSKFHLSVGRSRKPFKYANLDKISRFFEIVRNREIALDRVANFKLIHKIEEIREKIEDGFPKIIVWLVSNGKPAVPHEIEPVASRLRSNSIEVRECHLEDLVDLCVKRRNVVSNRQFVAREAGLIQHAQFGVEGAIGLISARELYRLVQDRADHEKIDFSLFDINVRGFLGLENDINKSIFKSASSSENYKFWALNNGITMIASSKRISLLSDTPKFEVKNLNIVNGAQTCSAIFESMKDFDPDFSRYEKLSVLFRIFFTEDVDLIEQIAISTNSQSRVNPRDLKANDVLQIEIQDELRKYGINYIRKRGVFAVDEGLYPLDALKAGQIILSYLRGQPDRAKRNSDDIFDTYYYKIFSRLDVSKFIRGVDLYRKVIDKREEVEEEIKRRGANRVDDDFVTYGVFHILAVCAALEERDGRPDSDDQLISYAIRIISQVLRRKGVPAYYTFFRSPHATRELLSAPIQPDLFEEFGG